MTGYTEIRYDEELKHIVVEPLEMMQGYRNFRGGSSAWEPVGPGADEAPDSVSFAYLEYWACVCTITDDANSSSYHDCAC